MANIRRPLRPLLLAALAALLTAAALAADSPEEFYAELERNLRAQTPEFSIAYDGAPETLDLPDTESLGETLRSMSARSGDGPDNADYPALNVSDGSMAYRDGAYRFTIEYLATPAELQEVARRAAAIAAGLDMADEDDFTRVKLLYEYIGTHYVYDDTLTKFSAYDGLTTGSMVCQGYALLTYRVMWNAGIPCRIVTGVSSGENHAWNIVKLDGRWYNLDATWDAADEIGGVMGWQYFLKSEADFAGHDRFPPYETEAYAAAHPMADESLPLPRIQAYSDDTALTNLVVRVGVEAQLTALLDADAKLQWSSSDPALLSVTPDGRVLASGVGEATLTVTAPGRRDAISAQIRTLSVDLRAASPWAFASVTDYYLAQLLPTALCGDFRQAITRGELALLCDQYIARQRGWETTAFYNPFEDIWDDDNAISILRCHEIGLMQGVSDTAFAPDRPVTREQAAAVLVRLMAYLDGADADETGAPDYPDADEISPWAGAAVAAATRAGVLQGTDRGFQPKRPMTREQIVLAMHRVYTARLPEAA